MRISTLKDKHKNQKGVIIGGGPSVKQIKNYNFDNYIKIGGNLSFEITKLDYLIFLDIWFWNNFYKEVNNLQNTIKVTHLSYDRVKYPIPEDIVKIPTRYTYFPLLDKDTFQCNNTGSAMLSLAHYLGLKELYLFGIDLTSQDNQTHFHNRYLEKGKQTSSSSLQVHYPNLKLIINILQKGYNIKIYSCSEISQLNQDIEYIDPKQLF